MPRSNRHTRLLHVVRNDTPVAPIDRGRILMYTRLSCAEATDAKRRSHCCTTPRSTWSAMFSRTSEPLSSPLIGRKAYCRNTSSLLSDPPPSELVVVFQRRIACSAPLSDENAVVITTQELLSLKDVRSVRWPRGRSHDCTAPTRRIDDCLHRR